MQRSDDVKEIVSILDMEGEGFDKEMEVDFDECTHSMGEQ